VAEPTASLQGQLLVATPPLADPNFDGTVVLVLEHGADGALGLVLNRPSATPLTEVLPEWAALASAPGTVFEGGPVATESVIALGRGGPAEATEGWVPVLGDIGSVDLGRDPLDLGVPFTDLRVWVGYAGWAPGQLEDELDAQAWFTVLGTASDIFSASPEHLWRDVLRRQRGRVAMFANYPEDTTTN